MNKIVPTILTSDIADFAQKIVRAKEVVNRVQIDIVDGKFAKNQTVTLEAIKNLDDLTGLTVDLHLMVDHPEDWINRSLEIVPDLIIGQVEMMANQQDFVTKTLQSGSKVGLALDLNTPVEAISEELYRLADLILVLAVEAGIGGQEFNPKALEKIKKVRGILGDLGNIGVDGGINEKNIAMCKEAGANVFYVGNTFWQAQDLEKRYNELLKIIEDRQ